MTAVAKTEEKPTLRTIARGALIKCGGDANRATKAVVMMLKRDKALLQSIVSEAIQIAAYEATQGAVRHLRQSTILSASEGRARVSALAGGISSSMLDFPLANGLRLGDATADQVFAQVHRYEEAGADMMRKARWLRLIAQSIPPGKTVGAIISDARANELWKEATR